ncbi:MAG TPA: ABC transporter permease [Gammaproteobacteria bacterium]|nr:ABC transporter permease [Gammaproteobacteria bacterium]
MSVLRRVRAIASKEVRQLRRDRLTLGMVMGIPLMQIILFGYAINLDVRHLRAAVADQAGTQYSRQLVMGLQASQVIELVAAVESAAEIEQLMRAGEIVVGVYIPPDFERRLQDPARPAAQLLVDGSDPAILGVAGQLVDMPPPGRPGRIGPPARVFELRNYYNPERRSAVQIVPALIGVILTMTMVLFTAVAIVRERERGNLEFLITTPVGTLELMLGKLLPYVLIGLLQVTIVLVVGQLLFGVPFRGQLDDLYIAALVFIAASLALGLLISTLARSQFQAMQMTFFFFLPSILLSGFMFPFDGMPRPAQLIAELLPLTHFVRMVRGIMLRGAELGELWTEIQALLLFFLVVMTFAVLRFRKRLD